MSSPRDINRRLVALEQRAQTTTAPPVGLVVPPLARWDAVAKAYFAVWPPRLFTADEWRRFT